MRSGFACVRERPASAPPTTLVLGLGNPLLADDSVGLRVVRELRPRLAGRPDIELGEDYWGGLRLMERMVGFSRAVIVDAMCSNAEPGTVHVLSVGELPTRHSVSAHDADLATALAVGRLAGAVLPSDENIRLVGIEAADVLTFRDECSPPVQQSIGRAAELIIGLLAAWSPGS